MSAWVSQINNRYVQSRVTRILRYSGIRDGGLLHVRLLCNDVAVELDACYYCYVCYLLLSLLFPSLFDVLVVCVNTTVTKTLTVDSVEKRLWIFASLFAICFVIMLLVLDSTADLDISDVSCFAILLIDLILCSDCCLLTLDSLVF